MYSHILSASFRMKSPDVSLVEWKDFKISPVEMGSFANPNQIDVIKKKWGEFAGIWKQVLKQGNHFKFSFVTSSVLRNHIFESSKKKMRE